MLKDWPNGTDQQLPAPSPPPASLILCSSHITLCYFSRILLLKQHPKLCHSHEWQHLWWLFGLFQFPWYWARYGSGSFWPLGTGVLLCLGPVQADVSQAASQGLVMIPLPSGWKSGAASVWDLPADQAAIKKQLSYFSCTISILRRGYLPFRNWASEELSECQALWITAKCRDSQEVKHNPSCVLCVI